MARRVRGARALAAAPASRSCDALRVAGKAGQAQRDRPPFDPHEPLQPVVGADRRLLPAALVLRHRPVAGAALPRPASRSTQSRLGLLFNGLVKVPMQFAILLLGVMVFVFYQFAPPPGLLQPGRRPPGAGVGGTAAAFAAARAALPGARSRAGESAARELLARSLRRGDARRAARRASGRSGRPARAGRRGPRSEAIALIAGERPGAPTRATPTTSSWPSCSTHLPAGLVGLVLAAIFAASMTSTSAELNALASTTVVDVYQRLLGRGARASGTTCWSRGWPRVVLGRRSRSRSPSSRAGWARWSRR